MPPSPWLLPREPCGGGGDPSVFPRRQGSSSFGVFVFESCSFPLAQPQLLWAVGRTDRKRRGPSCGACGAVVDPASTPHTPQALSEQPALELAPPSFFLWCVCWRVNLGCLRNIMLCTLMLSLKGKLGVISQEATVVTQGLRFGLSSGWDLSMELKVFWKDQHWKSVLLVQQ